MTVTGISNLNSYPPPDGALLFSKQLNADLFRYYDKQSEAPSIDKLNNEINSWIKNFPKDSSVSEYLSQMTPNHLGEYIYCDPGSTTLSKEGLSNLKTIGGAVWAVNRMISTEGAIATSLNAFKNLPDSYLQASRINFVVRNHESEHFPNKLADMVKGGSNAVFDLVATPENPPPYFENYASTYFSLLEGFLTNNPGQVQKSSEALCRETMPKL